MSLKNDSTLHKHVVVLWDYQILSQQLHKCDAILGLGSHDLFVPERVAELYLKNYAPLIIFTGGYGKITKSMWNETEAKKFADIAIKLGVPRKAILIEDKSVTTAENMKNMLELIKRKKLNFNSFIIVTKPYMERRVYGMFKKQWRNKNILVTSPQMNMYDYFDKVGIPEDEIISLLVGDVHRVKEFAKLGYAIEQKVPNNVEKAMLELIDRGYNKHLLPAENH